MQINKDFISLNYSERNFNLIKYLIIHYTEMNFQDAISKLCDPLSNVSAHYLIKDDGTIFQLVNDKYKAWHAGKSSWLCEENINNQSIGIELDNLGLSNFSDKQIISLINLCKFLSQKYNINRKNILGHSDIAPDRKLDPGPFFPWHKLAENGFGLWPKLSFEMEILKINSNFDKILWGYEDHGQQIEVIQRKLSKIGYKIDITGIADNQTNSVIRSFFAHFFHQKILKLGMEFYRNFNSKYSWDLYSEILIRQIN